MLILFSYLLHVVLWQFTAGWSLPTLSLVRTRVSSTQLDAQYRGLEQRREGATPTEGGMTLYCKAGPDGNAIGDCPFCHFVRIVLEEKGLEYELQPATAETKPSWLVEFYEGKMPALRHRKECYVESDVIASYLQFFFPSDLKDGTSVNEKTAAALFPAVAKYLKHIPDGDDDDLLLQENLRTVLVEMEQHLQSNAFWCGEHFSLQDCRLAPKLYHMQTGIKAFKGNAISISEEFPVLNQYMDSLFTRPSFQKSLYPESVVQWGWGNARK